MQSLKEFYFQKICKILPNDRRVLLLELEDVIVVNFDCIFNRDYSLRGIDQLVYQLHKIGVNKRFVFLFEDGASIGLTGAAEIIKNIINCFDLTDRTCAVVCREHISIDRATVIVLEAMPYWIKAINHLIDRIPQPTGPFNKKFAVWFHRGTFYRTMLVKHLAENFKDDSFISYLYLGMISDQTQLQYFQSESEWAATHTPIIYDRTFAENEIYADLTNMIGADRKPYNDYFIELIVETDSITTNWITEKTIKNLRIGKPFLVMAGVGVLSKIKTFGFKTFSPWINESYDNIENNYLRFEAIKQEVDRIASMSYQELNDIHQQMMPVFNHNREIFLKYV